MENEAATSKVIGWVTSDVHVECPHCDKRLHLNEYPYSDNETGYGPAEDELGLALFGRTDDPAKWSGLDIEYRCCGCKKLFCLGSLNT